MAKGNSTVASVNPLIVNADPLETLHNAKGVIEYLTFTATTLLEGGTNSDATHGLAMILECAAQALDHATRAMQSKGVEHA